MIIVGIIGIGFRVQGTTKPEFQDSFRISWLDGTYAYAGGSVRPHQVESTFSNAAVYILKGLVCVWSGGPIIFPSSKSCLHLD